MKTKKQIKTSTILKATLLGLGLIVAVPFCMGMYSGYKSHIGTNGDVVKTIKANCDCNDVNVGISAFGIQVNKEDGVSNESTRFELTGCKLQSSISDTATNLNSILVNTVEGYKDIDVVHLDFINDEITESILVKNGEIQ